MFNTPTTRRDTGDYAGDLFARRGDAETVAAGDEGAPRDRQLYAVDLFSLFIILLPDI